MGQWAIWAAKADRFKHQGQGGGRGKKTSPDSGRFRMVNTQRLSEARVILDYAPTLADEVLTGKGEK
jgi:hypothetical protein